MWRNVCRVAGILIGIGLAATGPALAQPVALERTLVLPFAVNVQGEIPGSESAAFWMGEAVALLLAEDLEARGAAVLSRAERVAAFESLQLPTLTPLTRATMIRVGELVGATELVVGEVRLGERVAIVARAIRLDPGRERARADAAGDGAEMYALTAKLADGLMPESAPHGATDDHLPLSAFEMYVKGLVASTPAVQERFLDAARQQVPTDGRILLAIWDSQTTQGFHDRALAAARAVPSESRFERQARFAAALSLIELLRYDEAFDTLQSLLDAGPSPVVSNALGVIQMRRGSTPQTGVPTMYFQQAVEGAPEQTEYLFNLGYAHARSRNHDEALRWLREVVRFDPADGEAHLIMSQVLAATERRVEAQRELDLARQLGTRFEPEAMELADRVPQGFERLSGRPDSRPGIRVADALANPAQREQQELATFHLSRGRRLFDQGEDRGAMDELRRAVYLQPYNDEAHMLLGRLYRRTGRLDEAVAAFKIAVWARESLAARLALAETLFESGDRAGALAAARRAEAMAPDSAEVKALIARIGGGSRLR
jgi:tetratricopeptide (TPR) repeat protein